MMMKALEAGGWRGHRPPAHGRRGQSQGYYEMERAKQLDKAT